MSLTPSGLTELAGLLGGWYADAELLVSDGTTEARAPAAVRVDEGVVTLSAAFGEDEANFEWRRRGVLRGGLLVDVDEGDFGRKPAGAVWTLEVPIELEAN